MKSKFSVFFLMIAIVVVMVLGIVVLLSVWDTSGRPDPGKTGVFGFSGAENGLRFDPGFSANTGFAGNPYQTGNSDRDTAVMIGASVSYVLREVKYFTLFIVVLTVLALNAYALIVYFVLDKIAKPGTTTLARQETRLKTMNNAVRGHFNAGKDPDNYINQRVLLK